MSGMQVVASAPQTAAHVPAVEIRNQLQRGIAAARLGTQTDTQLLALHAHAHVDARNADGRMAVRPDHQVGTFQLKLAETGQHIQRIGFAVFLAWHSQQLPTVVGKLFQAQMQILGFEFGQRMPRQQAGIDRHQQFGTGDFNGTAALADPQPDEADSRATPCPFGTAFLETHRLSDAFAQPGLHALRVVLDEGQQQVRDADQQRGKDQQHQKAITGGPAGDA